MTTPALPPVDGESPEVIRERALALTEYLLAVRARIEKPVRTLPASGCLWQHDLPQHPLCEVGPSSDGVSWLRVVQPPRPEPPKTPTRLEKFVERPTPFHPPELRLPPEDNGGEGGRENEEQLGENKEEPGQDKKRLTPEEAARIRAEFGQWLETVWRPWAAKARVDQQVRNLHRRLYDLRQYVDLNEATEELVWGHGIMAFRAGEHRVHYPLLVTPVAIEYDPDTSAVTVVPQGPPLLQTDPLSGMDSRYLAQVTALASPGGQVDLDVWDDDARRDFYARALRRMGHDPVLRGPGDPIPDVPHIHDTSVLFVRPRQRMLRKFLESLRRRLGDGDLKSIGALASILADEPSKLRMPADQPESWRKVGQRLLMPLPTNEAQESIARRLASHRSVVVQGPPGTGKTHTIRNLIAHLMAYGKRVLVVAQKEDPLRVLRDGLPEDIRALCLAVIGRSADQLSQLQLAARELSDRAATLDLKAASEERDRLLQQLEQAERDLGKALADLRAVAEREVALFRLGDSAMTAPEVGAWLREREEAYGDIPDAISPDTSPPLTADEFSVLLHLAKSLSHQDRREALRDLPLAAELPNARDVLRDRARLAAATSTVEQLVGQHVELDGVRALGKERVATLAMQVHEGANLVSQREGSWTARLGELVAEPAWATSWREHVAACQAILEKLQAVRGVLAGRDVRVEAGDDAERWQLSEQLRRLRQRLVEGKRVSSMLHRPLHKVANSCLVDGHPLRSPEDVDVVLAHLDRAQLRQELRRRWDEWIRRLEMPAPDAAQEPELWASRLAGDGEAVVVWESVTWPALLTDIRKVIPRFPSEADADKLRDLATILERCGDVFVHDELLAVQRQVASHLERGSSGGNASHLWRTLLDIWSDPELQGWDDALAEVRRIASLRPDAERYESLRSRLAAVAPGWAAQIDTGTAAALAGTGADCLIRWQWRQAQTWLEGVLGDVDPVALSRRVEQIRARIRRLTHDLVVCSAWLEVARNLDDRRRAALADWATALRKIGKGTGKHASRWQATAQRAMAQAVDAVPVWVMSIDRAIEQFAGGATFDVVIVDEASQADLFALPVLTLASRAVVVGDDQQIGPQLRFVGDVHPLISAHLADVPSADHFDPESSLYDHAVRRSPQRILLTEHFRCVPAIIDFSSRSYYDGKIEPLRSDVPAGIGNPVNAVFVPEGIRQPLGKYGEVNVAEAEALVDRLAEIVANPAYEGKTIGIVSLLSTSGQALYLFDRIRERIGPNEMERRRLRVGEPYTFQGDERDIVLISMVVSRHDGSIAAFTSKEYHRRVNVAASRARDQMWVFHSVQPGDLREDDARAWLLTYCQSITVADKEYGSLETACESDFERQVLRRLLVRGYRPRVQFRIGHYRIDFVLPAPDGRRLAIECDGDPYHGIERWEADIRRQAILERVGNCVFVRIRGSLFARDPDAAMAPVFERIEELGILPSTGAPSHENASAPEASTASPLIDAGAYHPATSSDDAPVASDSEAPQLLDTRPLPVARDVVPSLESESNDEPVADVELPSGLDTGSVALSGLDEFAAAVVDALLDASTTTAAGSAATATATAPAEERAETESDPERLPTSGDETTTVVDPLETVVDPSDEWVPVPPGHRSVAWLRPEEAEAARLAYRDKRDVPVRHLGKVTGWARYYASGSELVKKFRANVAIYRVGPAGERVVCWLRHYEAIAVLDAARRRSDVKMFDSLGRYRGVVQYFAPASDEALRFRSVTRLLRSRREAS